MGYLSMVPHYEGAPPIAQVEASALTHDEFVHDYMDKLRPCLVRGAVRHWPAFDRWASFDYLRAKVGNPTVRISTRPLVEVLERPIPKDAIRKLPFEELLADLGSAARGYVATPGLSFEGRSPLAPLADDVGGFPFVGKAARPRFYAPKRAFFFRDSYTDWHYHVTDETLMSQVSGTKEVLLLPPDSFEVLQPIAEKMERLWDIDAASFPAWSKLRPYRIVVEPGDSLYLPTFWWHAVESVGDCVGWTIAWCWRTPMRFFDPRLAGVRNAIKKTLLTRHAPMTLLPAAWSLMHLHRMLRPPFSV